MLLLPPRAPAPSFFVPLAHRSGALLSPLIELRTTQRVRASRFTVLVVVFRRKEDFLFPGRARKSPRARAFRVFHAKVICVFVCVCVMGAAPSTKEQPKPERANEENGRDFRAACRGSLP